MIDLAVIAVTSGLLAGTTSCLLPTYPILFNILSRNSDRRRASVLLFAGGLILAYMLFYSLLAILIMAYGWSLAESIDEKKTILFLVAAVLSFYFALDTLFRLRTLKRTAVIFNTFNYSGRGGAFISGLGFGTMITPCSAPFLVTGIMPVLASKVTYLQGLALMALFSISLGLPILALGISSAYSLDRIGWLRNNIRKVETLSSFFLMLAGAYFLRLYLAY
ncbi:MAG: cytochrome c biogenesis protein CcdA [Candidatus Altiarchaeota archaeon]